MTSAAQDADELSDSNSEEKDQRRNNDVSLVGGACSTGLRYRRARDVAQRHESESNTNHHDNNVTSHHASFAPTSSTTIWPNETSGGRVTSSCGNGGTFNTTTRVERGFELSSTPFKAPSKESALVTATPSSAPTAGETLESTVISSSHINIHRGGRRVTSTLRRQYLILETQSFVLLIATSIGFVLFLVFSLPLAALLSLMFMAISSAALIPVALSALRTRYQLEMEHPLGLVRYLPRSIRTTLMETTLHEYMMDTTLYMETRHLLLYFIPGLQPDQLMNYINQLPQRHRDMLLQPGLGRLMPSIMEYFIRSDIFGGEFHRGSPSMLGNTERGDTSISSVLTVDRDENGSDENGDDQIDVTLYEAITSLRQTLTRNFITSATHTNIGPEVFADSRVTGNSTLVQQSLGNEVTNLPANDTPVNAEIDDNTSRTFGGRQDNDIMSTLRGVVVELPPADLSTDQIGEQRLLEEEYEVEGRVLSDATSSAFAIYSAQASAAVSDGLLGTAEPLTSWVIRIGLLTGVFSGSGALAIVAFTHQYRSSFAHSSSITSELDQSVESSLSRLSGRVDRRSNEGESQSGYFSHLLNGLFASSAVGFLSAGFAYVIRNRARAAIAANREAKVSQSMEDSREGSDASDCNGRQ